MREVILLNPLTIRVNMLVRNIEYHYLVHPILTILANSQSREFN
jgi:hypothetical protein